MLPQGELEKQRRWLEISAQGNWGCGDILLGQLQDEREGEGDGGSFQEVAL